MYGERFTYCRRLRVKRAKRAPFIISAEIFGCLYLFRSEFLFRLIDMGVRFDDKPIQYIIYIYAIVIAHGSMVKPKITPRGRSMVQCSI